MTRRALITGATGFVGGHLAERLSQGEWRLRALVRESSDTRLLERLDVDLVRGSLPDAPALRAAVADADVVFHLAGVTAARDEETYRRVNAGGTALVSEAIAHAAAARGSPPRMVYLRSYAACGPSNGAPRRLDAPPAPLTAYGRTKLEGERRALAAGEAGAPVVLVRAPVVYGPRDRALLTYFRLVQMRLAPAPAGPARRLHVVFAPDLARALERAADAAPGTYAVAEPVEHTWTEVVGTIAAALGRRPLAIPLPRALLRAAAAASQAVGGGAAAFTRDKAIEMLAPGWVCELATSRGLLPPGDATPLAEGVARTVRWYKSEGWL